MNLGTFISKDGSIFIKGRSVKNKPIEPIINTVGLSKGKYMRTLLRAYRNSKFTDFDLYDLSELSLRQWKHRQYPKPKGFKIHYGRKSQLSFVKMSLIDLIRR